MAELAPPAVVPTASGKPATTPAAPAAAAIVATGGLTASTKAGKGSSTPGGEPVVTPAASPVASPAPKAGTPPQSTGNGDAATATATAAAASPARAQNGGQADGEAASANGGGKGKGLTVKAKNRSALNPEASVFTPTGSPVRASPVRSTAFPASWAPPAVVLNNSGLRPPAGVTGTATAMPAHPNTLGNGQGKQQNGATGSPATTSKSSSRRRKRRGRKRGASVDGDPRMVKLSGVGSGGDANSLRAIIQQVFGPVTTFTCTEPSPRQLVAFVTFSNTEGAEKAVRAGVLHHNGSKLKFSRTYTGSPSVGSAPTNVVRLSNLPLDTTTESLAKILAKHGARASSADMQTRPDGSFSGVVLCKYCSNDAAARAVNQLGKAVADGRALVAEYNLPAGAAAATAAAAPSGGGSSMSRAAALAGNRSPAASPPVPQVRHRLVPALPQQQQPLSRTSQRRRSRGYSEDWTSRRSGELSSGSRTTRYRKNSFAGSPLNERVAPAANNTWRERRARSLSGCGSAPPVPVHYAKGPDGSVGFELLRRGRSRSISTAAGAGAASGPPAGGAGAGAGTATGGAAAGGSS